MALKISNLLGKYRLTEELYAGERTIVYRAVSEAQETMGQSVVLKLLRQEYPTFNDLLQFKNQYTITKNLNIPGIIRPYNLDIYRNSYVLSMEDFGGISLANYMKNHHLSLQEVLEIGQELANILEKLHQNNVIHKDIKPANILIHPETKEIKLIDFSIASLLPKETQEIKNPHGLEGTLAYIAPEQTGRMNRGIDYRADFYELGVTLFQLLTRRLPFLSTDPMELLHCHIAKQPPSINSINPHISPIISAIIGKLMAKNAEDRYQSALGLKYDLEKCLTQLKTTGKIENFPIGTRDISDQFLIPEKLYGRELEVKTLLEGFDRVASGTSELMLVGGFSGIGKTALVNEIHKPITRQKGYFIKGKFDQFNHNIPFSAFVQAFRDLIKQLLSESDVEIAEWRTKILQLVGENGQVLIDVIPELENIIGKHAPAKKLLGSAAQNRFNHFLKRFVEIFATKEHPLVIFLDDWQWADSASLKLLKLLIQDAEYLLILGAYRDNEVFAAHPFILSLEEISKSGAIVNTITLPPLKELDMNQLVADTLKCELSVAQPLTKLVYQKTKGNPFFATQFLKALYDDKLISFDWDIEHWQCDIAKVKALAITDDIVEFMALQLEKLSSETLEIVKLASCMGTEFDLNTLVIVGENSPGMTAMSLWKALQEGLIIPTTKIYKFFIQSDTHDSLTESVNPTYKFLHDRVQQAAYSLIPEQEKQIIHLKIGKLLLLNSTQVEQEERLFDIINHLNQGKELITELKEREELAELNLKAGQKARKSTAYMAARIYLQKGIDLLTTSCWQNQYELTLNLYVNATEAAYLNGDIEDMEKMAKQVLTAAETILDKTKIYEIQICARTTHSQMLEAISIGRNALEQLGVILPSEPNEGLIAEAQAAIFEELQGKQIEDLVNLPAMTDPHTLAAMQLLGILFAPIFLGNPNLLPLLGLTMVNLSLKFGNAPVSTIGYAIYGMVLSAFFGEVEMGYRLGRVALSVLHHFNTREFKVITLLLFGTFLQHRQEPLIAAIPTLKDGYLAGMETGDFLYAGYNIFNYFYDNFFAGVRLDDWEPEIDNYCVVLDHAKQYSPLTYLKLKKQLVYNFREVLKEPDLLSGTYYDESLMIPKHHQDNELTALTVVYIYKLILSYFFGNYSHALENIPEANRYLMGVSGTIYIPIFHFYASLTHLAVFPSLSENDPAEIIVLIENHQTILAQWAHYAPMNHQHKVDLVEAEKSRILGQKTQAIELYDLAIAGAKENGFIQEEALANELAAKFYLNWGKEKVAQAYMMEAYYCYARWGATAKVADLERLYPQLLQLILPPAPMSFDPLATMSTTTHLSTQISNQGISDVLDFGSVIQAAQSISSTIQLDELLTQLTQIILTNSGGDKCVLIIPQDETWQVRAIATTDSNELCLDPLDDNPNVPIRLIQYVKRTRSVIVIDNLQTDLPVIDDYLTRYNPKSVLGLPILNQGKLAGIIYLNNQETAGVFTVDRLTVIKFLCTQAAISLENARLYQEAQTYAQHLEQSLKDLEDSQAKLKESAAFLEAQRESSLDGILVIDGNREVSAYNQGFVKIWNIPQTILDTKDDRQLLGFVLNKVEKPKKFLQTVEYLYQHLNEISYDEITLKDQRILERSSIGVKLLSGEYCGRIWYFRDITERKRSEYVITQKSQELEHALQDLQATQLQMIQSEKMSALGNLIAGVAHEINNPVGFLKGNINPALEYINDLFRLLDLIQAKYPELDPEIQEEIEAIDLEYIREDLPKLIGSMQEGIKRIQDISTSLRTFSRADTDRPVACHIHDGIDSTIMILKHRLKANELRPEIQVIKDYGDLPEIECYVGQLNQVFMNILSNAIDALEESNQGLIYAEINNHITVKTELSIDTKHAIIRIKDNGIGMSEYLRNKIFEHLFTTKRVGKGTGLGLAIARQIIEEKHHGKITVSSEIGVGTEFIISLPVK